jgi:hypothetical protein
MQLVEVRHGTFAGASPICEEFKQHCTTDKVLTATSFNLCEALQFRKFEPVANGKLGEVERQQYSA